MAWDLTKSPLVFTVCVSSYFIVGNGVLFLLNSVRNFHLNSVNFCSFGDLILQYFVQIQIWYQES